MDGLLELWEMLDGRWETLFSGRGLVGRLGSGVGR